MTSVCPASNGKQTISRVAASRCSLKQQHAGVAKMDCDTLGKHGVMRRYEPFLQEEPGWLVCLD